MINMLFLLVIYSIVCIYYMYWIAPRSTKIYFTTITFLTSLIFVFIGKLRLDFLAIAILWFGITNAWKYLVKYKIEYLNKRNIYSLSMFYNQLFYKTDKSQKYMRKVGHIIPYYSEQLPKNKRIICTPQQVHRGGEIITGSSGSGKTFFLESQLYQDMKNGLSGMFFDMKGEQGIIEDIKKFAKEFNVDVYEMSSYNTDFNYDPLANLSKGGRVEALLNTRKWSLEGNDAFYRTSAQVLIQQMVDGFEPKWQELKKNPKNNYLNKFAEYVNSVKVGESHKEAYQTLVKMLDLVLSSAIAPAFTEDYEKKFNFSNSKQFVVIFSFLSDSKEVANSLASFAVRDLLAQANSKPYKNGFYVKFDEYGSFEDAMLAKDMFEKGRSGGLLITASMQDLNQVILRTNESYMKSLLGTVNTFIIFAGATKDMAEEYAELQEDDYVEDVIMQLSKPENGRKPTAMYISKYGHVNHHKDKHDTYKMTPYIDPGMLMHIEKDSDKGKVGYEKPEKKRAKSGEIRIKVTEVEKQKYLNEFKEEVQEDEFKSEHNKFTDEDLSKGFDLDNFL